MKQTAVEWLVKHLSEIGYIQAPSFGHSIIDKAIKKAKEMEKEQIETAFFKGDLFAEDYFDADNPTKDVSENYYKQTYENNN